MTYNQADVFLNSGWERKMGEFLEKLNQNKNGKASKKKGYTEEKNARREPC